MSQCEICCDIKSTVVACVHCSYSMCRDCAKRLTTDAQADRGHCPSCNRNWTVWDLHRLLGKTFYAGPYRTRRQAQLIIENVPLLSASTHLAEQELRRRHLREEFKRLTYLIRVQEHVHLIEELQWVSEAIASLDAPHHLSAPDGRRRVVRCAHADCQGFVLNLETGQCGQCLRRTCTRCGHPDSEGHACDPNSVRSMTAIHNLCRPCVRCFAPSVREEGCPVMWCVHCHTFWNWDTGRIIDTRQHVPHNPDHREFQVLGRPTGAPMARELGDIPCGGLVDGDGLHAAFLREFSRTLTIHPGTALIMSAAEALHNAQQLRQQYPTQWHPVLINQPIHIAYLIGDVKTEAAFGQALERQERTNLLKQDVGEVLTTFVFSGADVLQRFCDPTTGDTCFLAAQSLTALRVHVDEALRAVSVLHGRKVPRLDHEWRWTMPYGRRI